MKSELFAELLSLLRLDRDREYAILDVGCGSGELLSEISRNAAPASRLVGIDASEKSIGSASAAIDAAEFRCAKFVDALGFDDETFDIVVSVDTLECISDKSSLIEETARILKPGGRTLFAHWDWETQVYNSGHKHELRRLVAAFADWQQHWMDACDGRMGRQLWGLFEGSGLFHGKMHVYTLLETRYEKGYYGYDRLADIASLVRRGDVAQADYDMIRAEMLSLYHAGRYLYSLNSYIYLGEKL